MQLIYEIPWWLPVAIGLAAIILGWTANNRQEKRLGYLAAALLILSLLLGALSYCLESPRQRVARLTHQLVATVAGHDWPAMTKLLHPDITILNWRGKDEVAAGAARYSQQFGIERAWVASLKAVGPDPDIKITMRVMVDLRQSPSFPTDWELEWQKDGDTWLLREVNPLGSPATGSMDTYFKIKP